MDSDVLIEGDKCCAQFVLDGMIYDYSADIIFSSSNSDVATVSTNNDIQRFVIEAKSPGKTIITGELDGHIGTAEIIVVKDDVIEGAGIEASDEWLIIDRAGQKDISFDVIGNLPTEEGVTVKLYCDPGLTLLCDGKFEGNRIDIHISEFYSLVEKGNLSVLFLDAGDESKLLTYKRIPVKIQK